jgi:hypothetical protein
MKVMNSVQINLSFKKNEELGEENLRIKRDRKDSD